MNNVVNVTRLDMTPVGVVLQAPNNFKPRSIALFPERGYVGNIGGQECGGPSKGVVCQLWSSFATVNRHICSGILCERDSALIYNNWSSDQQLLNLSVVVRMDWFLLSVFINRVIFTVCLRDLNFGMTY